MLRVTSGAPLRPQRHGTFQHDGRRGPSFDERIGWSIHGAYDDEGLPADVETRLSTFFRPHDDAFFEILGRRLAWRN